MYVAQNAKASLSQWLMSLAVIVHVCSLAAAATNDHYEVGTRHYAAQRWQLAAEEFQDYLAESPTGADAAEVRFYWAECLVQLRQHKAAHEQWVTWLRLHPDHELATLARFRLAELAYLGGRYDAAREKLEEYCKECPHEPHTSSALLYLGEIALHSGDHQRAIEWYQAALALEPAPDLAARCWFGLAGAYHISKNDDQAVQWWLRVVESGSLLVDDARLRLASVYLRRDQVAEAQQQIAAVSTTRDDLAPHVAFWSGRCLCELGKHGDAADLWQTAANRHQKHALAPRLLYEAGKAWESAGELQRAVDVWNMLRGEWPDNHWAEDAAVSIVMAHLAAGHLPEAIAACQHLRRSEATGSRVADVQRRVASRLLETEQYQLVLELFADDATASYERQYYSALAELGLKRHEAALDRLNTLTNAQIPLEKAGDVLAARVAALFGAQRYSEVTRAAAEYRSGYPHGRHVNACASHEVRAHLKQRDVRAAASSLEAWNTAGISSNTAVTLRLLVAEAFYERGEFTEARLLYQQASEQAHEPWAAAYLGQARCWMAEGKFAEAATQLERVPSCADFPQRQAEYCWYMAKVHQRSGRSQSALALYQQLLQLPRNPHTLDAYVAAARLLEQLERADEALELLARLADENPDYKHHDSALYQWAWILVESGRAEEADQIFQRLYTAHPNSTHWPDAAYRLAERAARMNDHALARQFLDELVLSDRDAEVQAHARYLHGQLAAHDKDWAGTRRWMQRLLDDYPATRLRLQAEYWLAEAAYRQGELDEAERRFAELAAAHVPDDQPWLAMIPLRQAQLVARRQQWDLALEKIEKLPSRFPDFAQQYEADYLSGRCLLGLARFQDARAAFERVLNSPGKATETGAMAQWMIGETYMHQRRYGDALRAYHRVELQYPYPRWQAAAALQIGTCHEAQSESLEAAAAYGRAAEHYGPSDFADEARRRLDKLKTSTARAARGASR